MKSQKHLAVLATVSLMGLSVACNDKYQEGFNAGKDQGYAQGYDVGYDDGYADGDEAGFLRAKNYFASADYLDGFNDGKTEGINIGYNQGYTVGKNDGLAQGYSQGYSVGKQDGKAEGYGIGYDVGYDDGFDDGWDQGEAGAYNSGYNAGYAAGDAAGYNRGYDDGHYDGYNLGYFDGKEDGYDLGYDAGWDDGYDYGYDVGFDDGWGLSVGKTKTLKGYANILSMVHNDLFDYSKIKAPKVTARGLVAGNRLLLSETSVTNKDTLKRAAVVEQYLVAEMAQQVKGKFGLSAERSLKIAKAANHFRKYSSTRALTAEDTNAYASEIMGVDFKSVEKAVESSMKGNVSAFSSVIEKAAEKNGTTPEKMSEIVSSLFL